MIMVRHQTISGYAKIPHFRGFNEKIDKYLVIMLIMKYLLASSATVHYMIPGIWIFYSQRPAHKILTTQLIQMSQEQT